MKKIKWILMLLILTIILSGCRPIKREKDTMYRQKQILASLFVDFKKFSNDNINIKDLEDEKIKRTMLIDSGSDYIQGDLTKDHSLLRSLVFSWGEGDLKYHFKLPGDQDRLLCTTLSATNMITYNISYIVNLPAKLISNIRTDLDLFYVEDIIEKSGIFDKIIINSSVASLILRDIFVALIGLLLATIMIPIGLITGFITHPIQTFFDIIPCLWGTLKTVFYAVKHLYY